MTIEAVTANSVDRRRCLSSVLQGCRTRCCRVGCLCGVTSLFSNSGVLAHLGNRLLAWKRGLPVVYGTQASLASAATGNTPDDFIDPKVFSTRVRMEGRRGRERLCVCGAWCRSGCRSRAKSLTFQSCDQSTRFHWQVFTFDLLYP